MLYLFSDVSSVAYDAVGYLAARGKLKCSWLRQEQF